MQYLLYPGRRFSVIIAIWQEPYNYTDKAAKVAPLSWNIMSKLSQNKTVAEAKDKKQNKLLQVNTKQSEYERADT